jgi:hypothetical protein
MEYPNHTQSKWSKKQRPVGCVVCVLDGMYSNRRICEQLGYDCHPRGALERYGMDGPIDTKPVGRYGKYDSVGVVYVFDCLHSSGL